LQAVAAALHKIVGLLAKVTMHLQLIMEDLADLVQKLVELAEMAAPAPMQVVALDLAETVQQLADLLQAKWRNLFLMVEEEAEMQEAGAALKFMVALEVVEVAVAYLLVVVAVIQAAALANGPVRNKVVAAAHLTAHLVAQLMKLVILAERPFQVLAE
jgi:hypothetical protein